MCVCDVTVFSAGACGEGTRGVQAAGGAGGEQVCVCQSSSSLSDLSLSLSSSALLCTARNTFTRL